ncbi:MAG TPA: aminoacyl--tRNA ligase-related protein [Patescibacteria group bacterium]|nr:aminoacyl--tRNA ligase-related protein [Patescibacteria group bacterium]
MRASQLFTNTSKTVPADETSKNAQLLIRAGFINKEMAGVYSYLPMGKLVLDNIIQVIREEMDIIGGNEISLTALQSKDLWEATGRWDDKVLDVWFKTKLANGSDIGLATTHEEPLTNLMRRFINSYKDLPAYPYQFQIKFRNELRAKNGLLRGREFWMKDLYSFSKNQTEHDDFYNKVTQAYKKVYQRLGIGDITYKTFASGGSFSKYSDEFQTISDVGEDTIFIHEAKKIAINQEVMSPEILSELKLDKKDLVEHKAVEVGNIFNLGTRYSEPLGLTFTDEDGIIKPVIMGSYGLGPSRIMGLLAELFIDSKGLIWPETIAPFKVFLAQLGDSKQVIRYCDKLYKTLNDANVSVFWDDRNERPGVKFADADLYGIPTRIVVSNKTVESDTFEVKKRDSDEIKMMTLNEILKSLVA